MTEILNSYELYLSEIYIVIVQSKNNTYYKVSNTSKINDNDFLQLVLKRGHKFESLINKFIKANNIFFETKLI